MVSGEEMKETESEREREQWREEKRYRGKGRDRLLCLGNDQSKITKSSTSLSL